MTTSMSAYLKMIGATNKAPIDSRNIISEVVSVITEADKRDVPVKLSNEHLQRNIEALKKYIDSKTIAPQIPGTAGGGAGSTIDLYRPTKLVTANYTATSKDYYIGVNSPTPVIITLPQVNNGREMIIKDESGFANLVPITIIGNIDNETSVEIRINNGAITLLYRDGWRII
jgi:hypothetical protein